MSVHIAEGSKAGAVGTSLRQKEIEELVKFIKHEAKRATGYVFDPDFFLVGDFNIERDGDRFSKALTQGDEPRFVMPRGMNTLGTNFTQNKTFDKIAWIPSDEFEFNGKFGVIPFGNVLYKKKGKPTAIARREVSDHLPLWAEFKVTELDHELDQIINL